MAEAVLSTITGGILEKLGSLIGQWWGVNDELEKLKKTVTAIEAVVRDAEKRPTMSDQVKIYIKNLKEVLYDADDLLDDFSTEALRKQVMSGNNTATFTLVRKLISSLNQLFYDRNMANQIKAITEKLEAIRADKEFFLVQDAVGQQVVPRETHSYIGAEEVIGRDDDKVKIIKLLMGSNSKDNVSIISIVGMGGLGKTALAQLVYNDDKIKNHFEKILWVCVSDVFDVKIIVKKIIKSATNEEPKDLELDQLQNQLRRELDRKKYLLVLDDVWEENRNRWLELANLLMGGTKGSWIVVTTRSLLVADITRTVSPHILQGLSETDSWSLFARMAFEQGKEPTNQSIIAVGKEIVEICGGVPLAIRAMGSLLYGKSESEWTYFKDELSYLSNEKREIELPHSSKKRKTEISNSPKAKDDILPTLKLSYNNLEPQLKYCFAYCSLFPKDHEIDVITLIYFWIAQGFVRPSNSSQSLEQIGYEYFKLLLWRSFFQDPQEDEWGKIVWCKMHDLMHDLAVEVAGEESIMLSSDKEIKSAKNTRHVSIVHYGYDLSSKTLDLFEANKIRTFLLASSYGFSSENRRKLPELILPEFRRLRMLDLHSSRFRTLPESIGELKRLRYLDLSGNYEIEMLPRSIARLQNLLVLKLSYCEKLKELPEQIGKLVSLMILEFDECDNLSHMPKGLGHLTSLQKLTRFIVSKDDSVSKKCGGLNELNGLNNLRGELMLVNLGHVKNADLEYKAAHLERKQHLQTLILDWWGTRVDAMSMEGLQPHTNLKKLYVSGYPGVRCPSWLSYLTNLVNLEFKECGKVKCLPPLDGLSSLRQLFIYNLSDVEYIECNCSGATFFSSLEILRIRKCPNLKGWRIGSTEAELPPFPCLSKLQIESCENLTSMPLFPTIEGELYLCRASGKPLEETMMMNSMMSTSSSSSSPPLPLSKLKSLVIEWVHDIKYLPNQGMRNLTLLEFLLIKFCNGLLSLAGEGFSGLTSLRSLHISCCQSLKSISGVFQHCTALKKLKICDCRELDFSDAMQCQGLRSLTFLKIEWLPQLVSLPEDLQHVTTLQVLHILECKNLKTLPDWIASLTSLQELQITDLPQLVSLPEELQHVTTLQVLHIWWCENLKTLPDWIVSLTSLQKLDIDFCPKFTSLPEGMRHLTSLQELSIDECPLLTERCGNNTGVDWPKISHIPNIKIDFKIIQRGGCYRLVQEGISSTASTDSERE